MSIGSDPNRVGATISSEDATTLAALNATGLPPGTCVYVTSLSLKFTLTVSTASLVANQIVAVSGIDGYRWIVNTAVAPGAIPLSDLAAQADQTVVGNVSGGSASPMALTQAQVKTFLGVATPSTAGLMSAAQAAFLASLQPGSLVPATLGPSTEVDFTTTPTAQTLFPKISTPGVMFVPWLSRWVITAKAGALSTQPTLQMGNNVALTNLAASASLSFATPFAAGVGAPTSSTVPANAAALTDASLQDYQITVSVAATGSSLTLKAKLFVIGFYTTLIQ